MKWAGGKRQLLPELLDRVPEQFKTYFEPFVGGGALFFSLQPILAHLTDINPDLINMYQVIQTEVEALIEDLQQHRNTADYFYRIRNVDRSPAYATWSPIQKASRLIYLNKTCYNGLYRVNSKGHFNSPYGSYKNPTLVDHKNLRACHCALQEVTIEVASFEAVLTQASTGDFVYFDPPYVPVSSTANFTSYSQDGFGPEMQERLRDVCVELDRRGVQFMLSNSYAPIVLELYGGFRIDTVQASRAINSNAAKRGKVKEVIVRNY
ncbi:MAG: DNA adenine methylase [Prochlorothrix sp.]